MNQIVEKAKELGELLKQSDEFKNYNEVKAKYEADEELQTLISNFNLKKMAVMNQMQNEENPDEEKLKKLQEEMRTAYSAVMTNETMSEFVKAKETFENLVNEMYGIINFAVTGVAPGGCDGSSCASCGGGCHG